MAIPRGYVRIRNDAVGVGFREKIKEALTIVPSATSSFTKSTEPIKLWAEDDEWFGVPRGFYVEHLLPRQVDGTTGTSLGGNDVKQNDSFKLRPGQPEVIEGCIKKMQRWKAGGAISEVLPGGGKTAIGCEIARRLGLKTLVIVHSTVLFEQWVPEINRFLPSWSIGKIQADKVDVKGKDICIGMLQSLALKDDYPEWLYSEFGLVIADECHLLGAPEFAKAIPKFEPKYILGLSGTVKRTDRAEKVFIYGIGPSVVSTAEIPTLKPQIYFIDTKLCWTPKYDGSALDMQKIYFLNDIVTDVARNEMIVRQAVKAAKAGRNVLILSERVDHVKLLHHLISERLSDDGVTVGMMVGTSKKAERAAAILSQVIVATVQLVGIGFNVERLDCLIFASPVQAIDQPIGRVCRFVEGKKTPLVLDLVDSGSEVGLTYGNARRKRYKKKGWKCFGEEVFPKEKKKGHGYGSGNRNYVGR
jgi:superfamily II DNA or RNA helicase